MTLSKHSLCMVVALLVLSANSSNASPYSAAVLADNPVSYWRLGDSGDPGLDEVGGRNLTYEGSPIPGQPGAIAGDPNTATGFSGDRSALSLAPDAGLQSQTFSIEAWAKITGSCEHPPECYQFIISQRSPISAGYQLDYDPNNSWGTDLGGGQRTRGTIERVKRMGTSSRNLRRNRSSFLCKRIFG